MGRIEEFTQFRTRMNEKILAANHRATKRFFGIDTLTYEPDALDRRTKELLALVASLVLRCDDCVTYHLLECRKLGVSDAELRDALSVGLTVGGSIVIPHLRRAYAVMEEAGACGAAQPADVRAGRAVRAQAGRRHATKRTGDHGPR